MKVYDAASIRNVALVGHSASGKTQLASAILADAGMINRFGKVDEGTTVTDYDEEEIARKHTLSASLAYAEWNKQKINLIDTPGVGNFLADALAALNVADAALVVVDAVAGVMVQTEKVWAAAEETSLPRLVAVNRLDRERASLDRTLTALRESCSCPQAARPSAVMASREARPSAGSASRRARPALTSWAACRLIVDGSAPLTSARSVTRIGPRCRRGNSSMRAENSAPWLPTWSMPLARAPSRANRTSSSASRPAASWLSAFVTCCTSRQDACSVQLVVW